MKIYRRTWSVVTEESLIQENLEMEKQESSISESKKFENTDPDEQKNKHNSVLKTNMLLFQ